MHLKPTSDNTIVLKSPREIALMREAGKIVAATIRSLEEHAVPGVTTRELDQIEAADLEGQFAELYALDVEHLLDQPRHQIRLFADVLGHLDDGPPRLT